MNKILTTLVVVSLFIVGLMGVAGASEHHGDIPEHPHAMLHNADFDPDTFALSGFDRCIELAHGEELPLTAHHHSVHQGTAGVGEPSVGFTRNILAQDNPSGHLVVPLEPFPFSPFEDCDAIREYVEAQS